MDFTGYVRPVIIHRGVDDHRVKLKLLTGESAAGAKQMSRFSVVNRR